MSAVSNKPLIVACIPAFNEERSIGGVVVRALRYVDRVVVCDDGSRDLTGVIAEGLGAVVVRHERNRGKGAALRSAFLRARELGVDVIVMLDADGQHDPEEIPGLVEPVLKGEADMVVGSRYVGGSRMDAPFYRRVGLSLFNALSGGSGDSGVGDTQSGFRAFSAKALDVVVGCKAEGYGVETEQLALAQKSGLRVVEVPVSVRYRGLGKTSKKNPAYHGFEIVDTVLRLVVLERPLLFLALPGAALFLVGVGFGVYFLWYFNLTRYFSVPMALVTVGAVFLGMLLLISSMMLYAIKSVGRNARSE
ncbi:MAG: glycosyltransferase family 2 protein [Candidatus Bathyarchaeota archaeon]